MGDLLGNNNTRKKNDKETVHTLAELQRQSVWLIKRIMIIQIYCRKHRPHNCEMFRIMINTRAIRGDADSRQQQHYWILRRLSGAFKKKIKKKNADKRKHTVVRDKKKQINHAFARNIQAGEASAHWPCEHEVWSLILALIEKTRYWK